MRWKLAGYGKWAAKLLMTEMLVPGGTLIVLALLLAGGSSPAIRPRLTTLISLMRKERRLAHGSDLMTYYALRRLR